MVELEPGAEFAGYRIEGVAGRGGMGVVYRAVQLALNRTVAVKVLAAELAASEQFRQRFRIESEIAASIDHPGVIPIYDAGEAGGLLYVTMRYVDGTDLLQLAARRPLAPPVAAEIVAQVAEALQAAHARGLVHRDVKPGNVLIEDPGGRDHVYLTDFGLTKEVSSDPGLTETGNWLGTVDYAAPEQIRAQPIDARADVYALGGVLYWALTGRVPYPREGDLAKMNAHLNEPPPLPPDGGPLAAVIERAMAKDPAERYGSAIELARAARAAVDRSAEPVTRRDGSDDDTRRLPAAAVAATAPRSRRTAPAGTGRGRFVAAGALVVAAALAILALAGAFDGGGGGPARDTGVRSSVRTPTNAEVTRLLQTYADRYGAEDAPGLGALMTPSAVRLSTGGPPQDRAAAIAAYRRQFAQLAHPRYRLTGLHEARRPDVVVVSGRYTIASDSGTSSGRIVFQLVERGGRAAIRRLDITPG